MLKITIPEQEGWNAQTKRFVKYGPYKLTLEHSLVSVSKWESRWHKAFYSKTQKTEEETLDYIRCMTLTQNVDDTVFFALTDKNISEIKEYIEDPMTASSVKDTSKNKSSSGEIITSELIYSWMINFGIPFECQKWHLNRLLMLIKILNAKNKDPKKMTHKDIYNQQKSVSERNMELLREYKKNANKV